MSVKKITQEQHDRRVRWIAELRSGRVQQGRGALRPKEDERCCLGVACDLAMAEGWVKGEWVEPEEDTEDYDYMFLDMGRRQGWSRDLRIGDTLPPSVHEALGFRNGNPSLHEPIIFREGEKSADMLAEANDNGATFEELADALEADLKTWEVVG